MPLVNDEEFFSWLPTPGDEGEWKLSEDARVLDDFLEDRGDPRAGFFRAYALQPFPRGWTGRTLCVATLTPRVSVRLAAVRAWDRQDYRKDLVETSLVFRMNEVAREGARRSFWSTHDGGRMADEWYVIMAAADAAQLAHALGDAAAKEARRVARYSVRKIPERLLDTLFGAFQSSSYPPYGADGAPGVDEGGASEAGEEGDVAPEAPGQSHG